MLFGAGISGLALTFVTVFYSADGAVAYARHTVGAVVLPPGFAVCQFDVIQRTKLFTHSAADTGVLDMKTLRVNNCRIKDPVYN